MEKKKHREDEYRTTSGSGHNKTMEKHEKTLAGRLKVKRTDQYYGDGIHGRTIERFDKDGNKFDKLYMEGKHDSQGNFHGGTKLEYENHKLRKAYSSKKEMSKGYFTDKAGRLKTAENEGNLRNAAMEDEQLRGANRNYDDLHRSTDEEYERDERKREYDAKDRKKLHGEKYKTGRKDKEVREEIRGNQPNQPSTTGPVDPKKAVKEETERNVEGDIEEEDKPKERIHSKEKRRKMYHSRGAGRQETLVHDKDRYTGKNGGQYRQREEEGEFTDQKPSSDFKHSKFEGTNDHEKSPTEFSRREEHVSDTDKRFLNTDKDYKVKTNPTHIEGPVTEEKRGTKVRVEKEGSVGDKALSKIIPKDETDLYDDKTGKHLKKRTYTAADGSDTHTYHSIDSRGKETPISQEEFEKEENAFENTPSDLDKNPQHPASLTTISKTTTTESFAEFQKQENMDIPTSSEEGDFTSFNTESQIVGTAERNASDTMKEMEGVYEEL